MRPRAASRRRELTEYALRSKRVNRRLVKPVLVEHGDGVLADRRRERFDLRTIDVRPKARGNKVNLALAELGGTSHFGRQLPVLKLGIR